MVLGRRFTLGCGIAALMLGAYLLGAMQPAPAVVAQPGEMCFQETGKCIRGAFLRYWQRNGGLRQQGFPISDEMRERNAPPPAGDGREHTVQYFQRARFEYHEEFAGTENEVLLGLLGSEQYQAKYQSPPPEEPITLQGMDSLNTRLFTLRGGNYTARWAAQDVDDVRTVGCFHGASIRAENGSFSESVGSGDVDPQATRIGETQIYNVPPGRYYLDVNSGCQWSITIRPQ